MQPNRIDLAQGWRASSQLHSVASLQVEESANRALDRSSSFSEEPERIIRSSSGSVAAWQGPRDLPARRIMVQRIMVMTKQNKRINLSPEDWEEKAPAIARRIELSLYSRAASLQEYKDITTLRRRLQSLVTLSYHEAAAIAFHKTNKLKRKRSLAIQSDAKKMKADIPTGAYLFQSKDVLKHIYSFLNGVDIVRHVAVNKFTARVLPSCVDSLVIETNTLQRGFAQHGPGVLEQFTSVRLLHIYNAFVDTAKLDRNSLHAWGCAELSISQSNHGERIIQDLASAIRHGYLKSLHSLCLLSVFTNTSQVNGIKQLTDAFQHKTLPQLKHLYLGGNSIADAGVKYLAKHIKRNTFPKLERLDLRRNFIGEAGVLYIVNALTKGHCKSLQHLCLGGNIISDNSIEKLSHLIASKSCPQIQFLGLEDNYISAKGVQVILDSVVNGGMLPKLHKVCRNDSKPCTC